MAADPFPAGDPFPVADYTPYLDRVRSYAEGLARHAGIDPSLLTSTQAPPTPTHPVDLEQLGRQLLVAIGEDPDRDGLRDTPARWARWWREFTSYDPGTLDTTFESVAGEQLVVVRGVQVWSLCEHHLIPFSTTLTMGYLTDHRVMGLSKLARVAHQKAHALQLQERLVTEIGEEIAAIAGTPNVGVIGTGRHLCMEMRGIRTPGEMVTSHLQGRMLERDLRAEFLSLHHGR